MWFCVKDTSFVKVVHSTLMGERMGLLSPEALCDLTVRGIEH